MKLESNSRHMSIYWQQSKARAMKSIWFYARSITMKFPPRTQVQECQQWALLSVWCRWLRTLATLQAVNPRLIVFRRNSLRLRHLQQFTSQSRLQWRPLGFPFLKFKRTIRIAWVNFNKQWIILWRVVLMSQVGKTVSSRSLTSKRHQVFLRASVPASIIDQSVVKIQLNNQWTAMTTRKTFNKTPSLCHRADRLRMMKIKSASRKRWWNSIDMHRKKKRKFPRLWVNLERNKKRWAKHVKVISVKREKNLKNVSEFPGKFQKKITR